MILLIRNTTESRYMMQWNRIENNWEMFKEIIQQNWNEISDEHIEMVAGDRAQFSKVIQSTYRIGGPEAEQKISDWLESQINIDGHFYTVATTQSMAANRLTHLKRGC